MIKITANGIPLLLKENTEITVKERNPLFESDISGTAYPVSIPAGDNMAAMKLMHRPGVQTQKIDINLEYGSYYRRLLGVVNRASASGFELSAKLDDSIFMIQNGDKDIRDAFPVSDITLQDIIDDVETYRAEGNDFCVPELRNPNFFGDSYLTNAYSGKQNDFITEENFRVYSPFIFLEKLVRKIAENGGYTVVNEFDDLIRRTFIYNNTSTFFYSAFPHLTEVIEPYYHLPEMTVRDFLNEFCLYFNLRMYPNHSNRTIRFVDFDAVAAMPAVTDWSQYLISEIELTDEQKYDKVILRHEVDESDPASPWERDQRTDISTFSMKPDPSEYDPGTRLLVEYEKMIYVCRENDESVKEWVKYSLNYPEIVLGIGTSEKKIITKFSALAATWNGSLESPVLNYARCESVGNWQKGYEYNEVPFRLGVLSYEGEAKVSVSSKSLYTGDFTGSINDRYSRSMAWYLQGRRLAEATFKIPAHILFNLDMAQKFYANGVTFYIEELNYRLTNNGIVYLPAKIRIF